VGRDFTYSTAIPPAPPYSAWDLTQVPGGALLADYIPDMNGAWKDDPVLRWVGEARIDPNAKAPSSIWILAGLGLVLGLFVVGTGVAVGSTGVPIVVAGIALLSVGLLPVVVRKVPGPTKERTFGRSSLTCPQVKDLGPIEEALRAALQRSGIKREDDHRRGFLGRGFEWRLDQGMRLSTMVPTGDDLPWIWLKTRGLENRPAHQVLKGHIQAALRSLSAVESGEAVEKAQFAQE
jgi:hypothetical protein